MNEKDIYSAKEMREQAVKIILERNKPIFVKIMKTIQETVEFGYLQTYCNLTYEEATIFGDRIIAVLEYLGYQARITDDLLFIKF